MSRIGYHASHEQFPPSELLAHVRQAEAAGFDAAMCSDHFHPWSEAQGHSGHAWCWLGSAMQATRLPFGLVNAPVGRYHPAVIAQAAATLAEMHGSDRFWVAVGSGEALNEHITGEPWPEKRVRNRRLREAADVMRALWAGEEVTHEGHVRVRQARLYSLPARPPRLFAAAISEATARWAGEWADGLITVSRPIEELARVVAAFRESGEGKPVHLQVKLSYDRTDEAAGTGAFSQWRWNVFDSALAADLPTPAHFEAAAQFVRREDMHRFVRISSDPGRHAAWLQEYRELGIDALYLHNVNREQARFIDAFGTAVLPRLRG